MLFKFLILAVIFFLIYTMLFKKSKKEMPHKKRNGKKKVSGDIMLECTKCETFVSEDEAILKDGKFYCSKECALGIS